MGKVRTKTCPKCRRYQEASAYAKNRRNADGLCSWCKECMRGAVTAWNQRNREYKNAYNREHRDPEYHRAYDKARRLKKKLAARKAAAQ